jgi:triosephosphate isomerase
VPSPYLQQCEEVLSGTPIAWGAQDVSVHGFGAFTGEVCAQMLSEFGCRYVIVGHSERRAYHLESSELVANKAMAVLAEGMTPIVCVGETLAQREAGDTEAVVGAQLDTVLERMEPAAVANIVVAYEPVWAIGTGKNATPEMAQAVHAHLRARIAARNAEAAQQVAILYGGSMKPENAAALLAALKARDFLGIIGAA